MADRIDEAVARIHDVLVPALRARIAELGEEESGAYEFYATRAAAGVLVSDYDVAIARKLEGEGLPARVHEVGGGFGTLCWLLAMIGVDATCIEHNRRRHLGAVALAEALAAAEPEAGARLRVVKATFPREDIDPAGATAILTNLVFTTPPERRAAIIDALGDYDQAIVDIDRFLAHTGKAERAGTLAEFGAAGLQGDEWLAIRRRACLWRFRRR